MIMPENDLKPTLKQPESLPFLDACIKGGTAKNLSTTRTLATSHSIRRFSEPWPVLTSQCKCSRQFLAVQPAQIANKQLFLIPYPRYSTTKRSSPNLWNIGPKGGYLAIPKSWRRTYTHFREAHVCASPKRNSRDIAPWTKQKPDVVFSLSFAEQRICISRFVSPIPTCQVRGVYTNKGVWVYHQPPMRLAEVD